MSWRNTGPDWNLYNWVYPQRTICRPNYGNNHFIISSHRSKWMICTLPWKTMRTRRNGNCFLSLHKLWMKGNGPVVNKSRKQTKTWRNFFIKVVELPKEPCDIKSKQSFSILSCNALTHFIFKVIWLCYLVDKGVELIENNQLLCQLYVVDAFNKYDGDGETRLVWC